MVADEQGFFVPIREMHEELRKIDQKVDVTDRKVDALNNAIGEMVAFNRRLDSHHKTLQEHDQRLDKLEIAHAVVAAQSRPRAPWYAVTGAVVGIVAGVVSLITLVSILGDISRALGG